MTITSTTLLQDINLDSLPDGEGKIIALPGAQPARTDKYVNMISPKQQVMIARFAKTNFAPQMTWAQAVDALRKRFRCEDASRDFAIATGIVEAGRHESAGNAVNFDGAQGKLLSDITDSLTGAKPHWYQPIQDNVDADKFRVRAVLTQQAFRVETNHDLTALVFRFAKAFGTIPPREERLRYEAEHLGIVGIEGEASTPVTPDGEPF
jgi:hypothetical protein